MKLKFATTSTFLLLVAFISCQTAKVAPSNSAERALSQQLGTATLWFQKSAEMEASFLQAYAYGKMLLTLKMDTLKSSIKKPAIILDLDETVLDNSPYEARLFLNGETYDGESWNNWCNEGKATALPGATDFLQHAANLGIEIFYISNRKAVVFESTLQNLKDLQLPNADENHLLLKTAGSDKTERRNIVTADHNVILYVGDNLTDYSEIYANRGAALGKDLVYKNKEELLHNFILLPNPMYGEWESAIYDNDFSKSDEEKLRVRREVLETKN